MTNKFNLIATSVIRVKTVEVIYKFQIITHVNAKLPTFFRIITKQC